MFHICALKMTTNAMQLAWAEKESESLRNCNSFMLILWRRLPDYSIRKAIDWFVCLFLLGWMRLGDVMSHVLPSAIDRKTYGKWKMLGYRDDCKILISDYTKIILFERQFRSPIVPQLPPRPTHNSILSSPSSSLHSIPMRCSNFLPDSNHLIIIKSVYKWFVGLMRRFWFV